MYRNSDGDKTGSETVCNLQIECVAAEECEQCHLGVLPFPSKVTSQSYTVRQYDLFQINHK